jgi:thymidylate kinase
MNSPGVHSSPSLAALTLEGAAATVESPPSTGGLLEQLALALDRSGIRYCQWKGHWSAHRWSRGYGDVDLLVDHAAIAGFRAVAEQLGFKLALPAGARQIPSVEHYLGFDPLVPRLLHLQVRYRLLLGEYWTPVYRIPLEDQILAQSVSGQPFRVPSPTHTFLIFALRMMLRQVGRPLLSVHARWLSGIQVPLASLEAASNTAELARLLDQHFPPVDLAFFQRCTRALYGKSDFFDRLLLPWQLHLRLRAHVRHPPIRSRVYALIDKFLPPLLARRLADDRMRVSGGGLVIDLIGGDGAGKSTCARELYSWLAPECPIVHADLGNPPTSLLTLAARVAVSLQQRGERWLRRSTMLANYSELIRQVCTARDRYRLYRKVHRFAVAGGVAVCERYALRPEDVYAAPTIPRLLPTHASGLARLLRQIEASYYSRILAADAVFVLKLDPELAVVRRPEEPAEHVRARCRIIWETDWSAARAHVVDASRPLPDVVRQLKTAIWSIY